MLVETNAARSMRVALMALALLLVAPTFAAANDASSRAAPIVPFRAHMYFDDTMGSPPPGIVRGAKAKPLIHPKRGVNSQPSAPSGTSPPPDPEVLGFVQAGEVSSHAWAADLHFNLLSTVAYFGLNVHADGTLVTTNDAGYSTWWSSEATSLINAAHDASDRVVLTVKAFNDSTIAGATGSEQTRQTLINAIISQVVSRPADGVNIDFEGISSSLAANFTTFIAELQSALNTRAGGHSYLTIDAYASAGLGGTMYDLAQLWHHVDAIDLMGYGFAPCRSGSAGPSAPMGGCWYNVTQAVSDYMSRYGVPASELLLGVPYYGYKWSVSGVSPQGQDPVTSGGSADTYSAALSDFNCALQLQQHWDATFQGPWATWYSPGSGDPCGGNHNSYRELYYDNAQSLGLKYDLVNSRVLRGIAIWALGYDSGTNDLWNEISTKFTVSKPHFQPHGVGAPSAAASADGSQQVVFWSGPANHLFEAWFTGSKWHGPVDWTAGPLGGLATLQSSPTVAMTSDGSQQVVFWQGSAGHLFEAWWTGGHWNGPVDWTGGPLGGAILGSAPSVAITHDGSQQLVFWRGSSGRLYEAWWGAGRWNGPVDWTDTAFRGIGALSSAPTVTINPDGSRQEVFWQGASGHLYEAWWTRMGWNGPVDWTGSALGGAATLASAPAAVALPNGSQAVFWRSAIGHLEEAWWAGRWNGPVDQTASNLGMIGLLTSAPSVAGMSDNSQAIFWQGASQSLWEAWYTDRWNGPADWSAG